MGDIRYLTSIGPQIFHEKLEEVFNKLDSSVKINGLCFSLRDIETGEYRYFHAHKNNTLFEKSHILCNKADLITIQEKV